MVCWDENLFKCSGSHDQDGFQAHIWYKPSKIPFFGTKRPMTLILGIQHRVLRYYQICSNDDNGLTLTIFIAWLNLFPNASDWVKTYTAYSHVFPSAYGILCTQVSDTGPWVLWLCSFNTKASHWMLTCTSSLKLHFHMLQHTRSGLQLGEQ